VPATQTTQSPSAQGTPSDQPASAPPVPTAAAPGTPSETAASQSGHASSSIVTLDAQQRTTIGQAIAQRGVKPLTNVSFSIAVGTKVPAVVQLRALPSELASFVPQYRGYSYVLVEEQIVIVDPGTHEIVSMVPYTVAAAATSIVDAPKPRATLADKSMVNRSVNLHTDENAVNRRPATEPRHKTRRSVSKREFREERGARTMTVEEFAERSRAPAFRSHRFVDDDVIIAPRQNGFFGFFR
jgi:hypothetical protein